MSIPLKKTTTPQDVCVVLGGNGFVGSAIVEEARRHGYQVHAIGRANYDKHIGTHCNLLINANGNSKKYLASQEPKTEFDLSVRTVQHSLVDFPAERYVYLSTIDVYPDHTNPTHNHETASIDPAKLSRYGCHKYLAEQLVQHYSKHWLILRMGGFVGSGLKKNSIYDMLKNSPLRVHPDSCYQYLPNRTLAHILFDLLDQKKLHNEIVNTAGDGIIKLREIASLIPQYKLSDTPQNATPEHYEINITKLKSLYPVPSTQDSVRQFIKNIIAGTETLA